MSTPTNGGEPDRPPLDDVMLAMDVVDTLRRRERLVARELDESDRAEDLKQRLRRIYAQQGIEVPDHVIEQGVAALREDRFTYQPPGGGLGRRLALIYVRRDRWAKWFGGGALAALLAAAVNYFVFIAPDKALPETLSQTYETVQASAASDSARQRAQQLFDSASDALQRDDSDAARDAIEALERLHTLLQQEYVVQVVNRAGERSGVWRVPDVNQQARNLYIIVEAVDASGRRLKVPVTSEEDGKTAWVDTWGLRVEQGTFDAVKRDKQDDGIIENDRFGYKRRGYLQPDYEMPTNGGAITRW